MDPISPFEQYEISNMYNQYNTMFGSSSSADSAVSNINQAYDPNLIADQAEQVLQNIEAENIMPQEQTNALVQLSSYANSLYQAASQLGFNDTYNYQQNMNAVSDSAAVSAESQPYSTPATYDVNVYNLAKAQQNIGTKLTSDQASSLTPGTYTFNVNSNPVSFDVQNGDTNKTVLCNMASAINNSNIGVKADVNTDANNDTSQLVINSENTGINSAFTLNDMAGNAAAYTGAYNVSQEAQNADYAINGESNTSQTNTAVTNDGNATLTFSDTVNNATVTLSPDNPVSIDNINNFITAYNNMVNFVGQNQDYLDSAVMNNLINSCNDASADLQSIGITQNSNMTLNVDQNALNNSLQNNAGTVQSAINGFNGLATNAGQFAQDIINSPISNYANTSNKYSTNYAGLYNSIQMQQYNLWSALFTPGQVINTMV